MTQPKKREGFLYGALMLSLSGILVKIIGIFFPHSAYQHGRICGYGALFFGV